MQFFLIDAPADEFSTTLIYARNKVNSYLFVYASSVAILHRRNEKGIREISLKSHVELFPRLYIEGAAFGPVCEEAVLSPELRVILRAFVQNYAF